MSAVADLLARAMSDDPLWRALGIRDLRWLFERRLRLIRRWSETGTVDGRLAWHLALVPSGERPSIARILAAGLGMAPVRIGIRRTLALRALADHLARDVPPGADVLEAVAVDPALRGRGIGTSVLRERLARADRPVALHTQAERNVRFYGRLGFAVTVEEELDVLGTPVPSWTMLMPPRSSPGDARSRR